MIWVLLNLAGISIAVALIRLTCLRRKRTAPWHASAKDDEGKPVEAWGRTPQEAEKRLLAIIDRRHDERVAKGWAE